MHEQTQTLFWKQTTSLGLVVSTGKIWRLEDLTRVKLHFMKISKQ